MKRNPRTVLYVSPHERLANLRAVPFLESMRTDDLVPLAEHAREVHHRRGTVLVNRGEPVDTFRILVEGEAMIRRNGRNVRHIGEGYPLGVLALLARDEHETEIVAVSRILTLEIPGPLFFALLEERFDILHHILRATARQLKHEREAMAVGRQPRATDAQSLGVPHDLVDRFIALQQSVPFGREDLFGLWHLARRAHVERFEPGQPLRIEGQPSVKTIVLTEGAVGEFGPGDAIGAIDTLAEEVNSDTDIATLPSTGIVIEREELLDIFEDHFEMAASCLAVLARYVLELVEMRAASSSEIPSGFDSLS